MRFDDSIDVIALLNRKLVSQTPERRTMPRLEVRCLAHIKCGENFWPAMLRNISSGGLQLEGDEVPAVGTFVSVFVEGLNIPCGEVLWSAGQAGRRRAARGAELDLDHPVGARDRAARKG